MILLIARSGLVDTIKPRGNAQEYSQDQEQGSRRQFAIDPQPSEKPNGDGSRKLKTDVDEGARLRV